MYHAPTVLARLAAFTEHVNKVAENINYGGCCVVAAIVAKKLQAAGVQVEVVAPGYDTSGNRLNNTPKQCKPTNEGASGWEWCANGLRTSHFAVRFKLGSKEYTYDTDTGAREGGQWFGAYDYECPYQFGHGLTPAEAESIGNTTRDNRGRDFWNPDFDREQIPTIQQCADEHLSVLVPVHVDPWSYENYLKLFAEVYKKHFKTVSHTRFTCYVRDGIWEVIHNSRSVRPKTCTSEWDVGHKLGFILLDQGWPTAIVDQHTRRMQDVVNSAHSDVDDMCLDLYCEAGEYLREGWAKPGNYARWKLASMGWPDMNEEWDEKQAAEAAEIAEAEAEERRATEVPRFYQLAQQTMEADRMEQVFMQRLRERAIERVHADRVAPPSFWSTLPPPPPLNLQGLT